MGEDNTLQANCHTFPLMGLLNSSHSHVVLKHSPYKGDPVYSVHTHMNIPCQLRPPGHWFHSSNKLFSPLASGIPKPSFPELGYNPNGLALWEPRLLRPPSHSWVQFSLPHSLQEPVLLPSAASSNQLQLPRLLSYQGLSAP